MDYLVLPELSCPFPPAINRYAYTVDAQTTVWARQWQLLPDEGDYRRLRAVKIGWLIARAYPALALADLQLVTDWTTWGFIWDDHCSQPGIGKQPEQLAVMHERFLEILRGAEPVMQDGPLGQGLHDLRCRIGLKAGTRSLQRFVRSVEQFFAACVWEAANRARDITPDLATYVKMRPHSGGLYTYFPLIELVEPFELPTAIQEQSVVQRMTLHANNVVCWTNDIISLAKELNQGDVHNLVLVLQHKHRVTLQEAVDRAAVLLAAEMRAFIDLELRLPSFGPPVDHMLRRYVATLRAWMRGNLDWSSNSGRYLNVPGAPVASLAEVSDIG